MGRLILVTGGARSGKSDYALQRAEALPAPHCFLATCPPLDKEMAERIRRHREDRAGKNWQTREEEVAVAQVVRDLEPNTTCLLDCLTLWVNNLLYLAEQSNVSLGDDEIQNKCLELIEAAADHQGSLICVTNEVGMGIVPEHASARHYRDLVGRCNRMVAAAADEVILVSCGLPMQLKPTP